jgi:hypothetical protein
MKHLLSLMLMVSMAGVMSAKAQTALDLNEGLQVAAGAQAEDFTLSWWGKTGRTYFVQQSFDLMTWQYVPVIESGAEAVCGLNVSCSETRQFWKLRYTDAPTGGNAQTADFDGDGLANLDELYYGADPFKADSDDDSLTDYAEVMTHFTNPLLADTDGDTLSDSAEVNLHLTNPTLADTDGDALSDDAEINLHMTDPNDFDGDDDLLPDGWEVAHSLNPKSALGSHGTAGDPDADLLTNLGEYQHSTNPWDADTDDDTLSDYAEVMTHFTNPLLADTDGDTLSDSAEINLHLTSPTSWDTDGDNLSDGAEVLTHGSNPLSQDSDSDGLSDAAEVNTYQTNPNAADSDADGITDKSEIKQGANANSASSRPAFESVEVGGNGEAGERKTEQVTLTLPEGEKSYLVVVAVQSEEYPGFTGTASEYDDVVDWKITPAGGAVIEGEKHVNELHADWEQSQEEGTSFLGLSPVAIVATEIIKGKASGTTSVQIELGAKNVSDGALPSTVAAMVMPVELILDNNNIAYKPESEALGVSNYVTTTELPADSQFGDVNADPENFRLQAKLLNSTVNSVQMKLEVRRDVFAGDQMNSVVVATHDYTLNKKNGDFLRGEFLRLVSDTSDDAVLGDQTILVKIGDKIKASYEISAGNKVEQEIQVCRPSSEDNNDPTPWKHDIKELRVNIVVMKNSAGTGPVVPRTTVDEDIDATNERLAQSGIRLKVLNVNMGAGDSGVDFPAMQGANYTDGFDATIGPFTIVLDTPVLQPLTTTSPDENALFSLKDTEIDSIDIFYTDFSVATSELFGPKAFQYRKWRNNTGNIINQSTALISSNRTVFTMCHEIMHILLNSGEHGTATTAVRYAPTTGKEVDGTKRIGPYPGSSIIDRDDTTTIRQSAETLP